MMDLSFTKYVYFFLHFLLLKARDQEEHPALKSDCLVHNFGLFKQVRNCSPFLQRRKYVLQQRPRPECFLLCEDESIFLSPVFAPLGTVLDSF